MFRNIPLLLSFTKKKELEDERFELFVKWIIASIIDLTSNAKVLFFNYYKKFIAKNITSGFDLGFSLICNDYIYQFGHWDINWNQ